MANPYEQDQTDSTANRFNSQVSRQSSYSNKKSWSQRGPQKWLLILLLCGIGFLSAINTGHAMFVQSYVQPAKLNEAELILNLLGLLTFCIGIMHTLQSGCIGMPLSLLITITGMGQGAFLATSNVGGAYAQNQTADMAISYMKNHQGNWPASWRDLEPFFNENDGRAHELDFEKIKALVFIDFNANIDELKRTAELDKVPFNLIYGRSYWSWQLEGGPNDKLNRYFVSRKLGK